MSRTYSLSRGTITNAPFSRGENKTRCSTRAPSYGLIEAFHSFGFTRGNMMSATKHAIGYPQIKADRPKLWVSSLAVCNNEGPISSTSVSQTTEVSTPFLLRSQDTHRQMITVAAGQPIALSSGCCPHLCLRQLDSGLTGEHGSATVLRDFVKCVGHQNARAAPAEVSHPLLTLPLLAPPVTCEVGNERRGGAVIYITNVRVRRTWTPLVSVCLISLSDQMGMHNTSDGQYVEERHSSLSTFQIRSWRRGNQSDTSVFSPG